MPVVTSAPIGLDEFLSLSAQAAPDETLELIDGELQSRAMTTRSAKHSTALMRTGHVLINWLERDPNRVGIVAGGESRCRLRRNPQTIVGIDVGVWLGEEFREPPESPPLFDASPVLAIEVLSLSDTHESVSFFRGLPGQRDRVRLFLDCGVPIVWVVDASFQTVTVYRKDREPQLFSASQEITAEPELSGFKTLVRNLFTGSK